MLIDIILILFIFAGGYFGLKKGIINVVNTIIAILLSVILSALLQNSVANVLNESKLGKNINIVVKENIEKIVIKDDGNSNSAYNAVLGTIKSALNIDERSQQITLSIIRILSFVAIFILITIVIFILKLVLNIVVSFPVLSSINKLGGLGFGVLKNIMIVYILLSLIFFLTLIPQLSDVITSKINSTYVTKILYNNNVLVKVIHNSLH